MAIVSVFPPSLRQQGQNDFSPMPEEMVGVPKIIAQVKALQADHGMGHAICIQPVAVRVELLH